MENATIDFKANVLIARDKITGFKGIIIGYCTYTTGCDQYLLAPKVSADGDFKESRWFDVSRVQVLGTDTEIEASELLGVTDGADMPAPRK